MDLPVIIKLTKPVTIGDSAPVTELKIERMPEAGDLYDLPAIGQKMGDLLNVFGKMIGQPPSFMKRLDLSDAMRCVEVIGDFLPGGQEIGASQ